MRRKRNTALLLFLAAVIVLAALAAFFIATAEVTYTTFLDTVPVADCERRGEAPYSLAFKDADAVNVRDLAQPDGTVVVTLTEDADTLWVSGKPNWPEAAAR